MATRKISLFFYCALLQFLFVEAQDIPRALIITGNGNIPKQLDNYPPWTHDFHNEKVKEILRDIVLVDSTSNMADLNAANLKRYDLIISNSLFLTPNEQQLDALYRFVEEGKSYFTLHCGILSCMNWSRYQEFMGGHFIGGPSNDPETFRVYTSNYDFWGFPLAFKTQVEHPISLAVDDFDTRDELYYFQPSVSNIEVIARAENHPVMWWHPVGKGKVMSLTLGHDLIAKNNPGYQSLLKNGVRWLTNYPILYSKPIPIVSSRSKLYPRFFELEKLSNLNPADIKEFKAVSDSKLFAVNTTKSGNIDLVLNDSIGMGSFLLTVSDKPGRTTKRSFDINVVKDGTGNIARYYGNNITATEAENGSTLLHAANMIDGDTLSRWSSKGCDEAFIIVDLQKVYPITTIRILWEASYARNVEVLSSTDEAHWTSIYSNSNSIGGMQDIAAKADARYLKLILKDKPAGKRGFSIYELEVY